MSGLSEPRDFVSCRLCGKHMQQLTESHLKSKICQEAQQILGVSIISLLEYKKLFPGIRLQSERCIEKIWKKRKENDPTDEWAKRSMETRLKNDPEGLMYRKVVETRTRLYGPSGVKDPEKKNKNVSRGLLNGGAAKAIETRHKNNPNNECYQKTIKTRSERYNWAEIMKEKAWKTRRERYGYSGYSDPETNSKIHSKAMRQLIYNMTQKEKEEFLRNTIFKGNLHPNVSECGLIPILEPLGFVYNGRGPNVICGHIPDFVNISDKALLIEFDGFGNHNPSSPWTPDTWEECLARDSQRDGDYRSVGYSILRILPEHLNRGEEFIQNMVREWMN